MSDRKVLFVTERWCDANPDAGETNSVHNFFGSLEMSGLADHSCLHFDEFTRTTGMKIDFMLLEYCKEVKPDLIFFTYLYGSPLNPDISTIAKLKDMGFPLVFVWFDAVYPHIQQISEQLAPFSTVSIVLDTENTWTAFPDKFITLWTPQDPRIYNDPVKPRDIDVSFAGSVRFAPDRKEILPLLQGLVHQTGGQRENKLKVEDYADVFKRSKIALNFSRGQFIDKFQIKGRVFESMLCGAMLMEHDHEGIKKWYEPYKDYVPFTAKDVVDKVKYYLANDRERQEIATNGWAKTMEQYDHVKFWQAVFERCGV